MISRATKIAGERDNKCVSSILQNRISPREDDWNVAPPAALLCIRHVDARNAWRQIQREGKTAARSKEGSAGFGRGGAIAPLHSCSFGGDGGSGASSGSTQPAALSGNAAYSHVLRPQPLLMSAVRARRGRLLEAVHDLHAP